MAIPRPLLRFVLTGFQLLRRAAWKIPGMQGEGVHAVALTPHGKVVLIRLTYAPGWRLPGGGKGRRETREEAMLRELREEIGLVRHGEMRPAPGSGARDGYFLLTDVEFNPPETYEVDEVRAFDPEALPDDMPGCVRDIVVEALGLDRTAGATGRGTGAAAASLAPRTDPQTETIMSRIPSKAMPHAYAPGEGENDSGGGGGEEGGRSITERAGEIAKKVGASKAAKVAAGAVVAAGVAAAATKIVRSRRKTGGDSSGGGSGSGSGSGGTAKKSSGRKSSAKSTSSSS